MKTAYKLKSATQLIDGDWKIEIQIFKKSFWPWKKDKVENAIFIGQFFWYKLPEYWLVPVCSGLDGVLNKFKLEAEARRKYEKSDD